MTNITDHNIFQNSNIYHQQLDISVDVKHDQKMITKTNNEYIKYRTRCPFTKKEDKQLLQLVQKYSDENKDKWYLIANHITGRTARQCRERYQLYLCDGIKRKVKWTKEEDVILLSKYNELGPHWKDMEEFFKGRTSYNIKNRYISLNRKMKKEQHFHIDDNGIIDKTMESFNSNDGKNEDYTKYLEYDFDTFQHQNDFDVFNQFDYINF